MDEDGGSEGEQERSTETPEVTTPSTTETGTGDALVTTEGAVPPREGGDLDAAGSSADAAWAAWAAWAGLLSLSRN